MNYLVQLPIRWQFVAIGKYPEVLDASSKYFGNPAGCLAILLQQRVEFGIRFDLV